MTDHIMRVIEYPCQQRDELLFVLLIQSIMAMRNGTQTVQTVVLNSMYLNINNIYCL